MEPGQQRACNSEISRVCVLRRTQDECAKHQCVDTRDCCERCGPSSPQPFGYSRQEYNSGEFQSKIPPSRRKVNACSHAGDNARARTGWLDAGTFAPLSATIPSLLINAGRFLATELPMPYVPHTEEETRDMLAALGVPRLADMFADVPAAVRFPVLRAGAAFAAYPDRPVRIVVANTPGGPSDIMARIIAAALQDAMAGSAFVVENKGGGGGNIGMGSVARAESDGYTILLSTSAFCVNPGSTA